MRLKLGTAGALAALAYWWFYALPLAEHAAPWHTLLPYLLGYGAFGFVVGWGIRWEIHGSGDV